MGAVVLTVLGLRLANQTDKGEGLSFNIPTPAFSTPQTLTRSRALDTAVRFVRQDDFKRRGYTVAGMRRFAGGWRVYLVPRNSIPSTHTPVRDIPKGRLCLDLKLSLGAVVSSGLSSC
jgi:hypothetical protein